MHMNESRGMMEGFSVYELYPNYYLTLTLNPVEKLMLPTF